MSTLPLDDAYVVWMYDTKTWMSPHGLPPTSDLLLAGVFTGEGCNALTNGHAKYEINKLRELLAKYPILANPYTVLAVLRAEATL